MTTEDSPTPPAPRFGLMNTVFGLILLSIGGYRSYRSIKAAEASGGGDAEIYWLAIILGSIIGIAGMVQLVFAKK